MKNSDNDLWRLEEAFWSGGRDGARTTTAAGAIVLYPYPSGILQEDTVLAPASADTGWRLIEMADRSISRRGPMAILTYSVRAQKDNAPAHEARCATTWLNDAGSWVRLSHQQVPATAMEED